MHDDSDTAEAGRTERSTTPDRTRAERDVGPATRRRFLAATAGSGLLAAAIGCVAGQSGTPASTPAGSPTVDAQTTRAATTAAQTTEEPTTTAAEGPPKPPFLGSSVPVRGSGVVLQWVQPSNPCESAISHYVVTLDGDRVTTVPAGATRAMVSSDAGGEGTYGVVAVDESGRRSPAATVEAAPAVGETYRYLRPVPASDSITVGETVAVDLVVEWTTTEPSPIEGAELIVELSSPCAAKIQDASVPTEGGGVEAIHEDGASAEIVADGSIEPDDEGRATVATLELIGLAPGAATIAPDHAQLIVDGTEETARSGWTNLAVESGGDRPAPPEGLSVSQGTSASVDVSWDGVSNPCDTDVDHYVVSVDGSDEETVPVGVTKTNVYTGSGSHTVGVRSVTASGAESVPALQSYSVALADPAAFSSLDLSPSTIGPDEVTEATVGLRPGPFTDDPSTGGPVTVTLSSPCAAEITGVTFTDGAPRTATATIAEDGASVTLVPDGAVPTEPGSTATLPVSNTSFSDTFAKVEIEGRSDGHTLVEASFPSGLGAPDAWERLTVSRDAAGPSVVGTAGAEPRDPDDDGLYEDVNGNERQDIADAVDLFQHRDGVETRYFDFNDSGDVSIGDAVSLFRENTG